MKGAAFTRITVECYSGFKADERPTSFQFHEVRREVEAILKQWIEPGCSFFLVRGDDGGKHLLRRDDDGEWTLRTPAGVD